MPHYIFLYHKSSVKVDAIVRNSCYTGYSYLDNLPSFVHGNTLTNYKRISIRKSEVSLL